MAATAQQIVDVTMPQMGVSVAEGTVVEWKKAVGDKIARDAIICSISTDKIDTDVESPASGTITEIVVDVGQTVDVGTVMAKIATEDIVETSQPGENIPPADVVEETGTGESTAALSAPGRAGELSGDTDANHPGSAQRTNLSAGSKSQRYSPVVARMAAEHKIDLESVKGTGRGGRVRKQDILAAIKSGGEQRDSSPPLHIESPYRPEPAATSDATERRHQPDDLNADIRDHEPLSRIRQMIGQHMLDSLHTTATCTTIIECDMLAVERRRADTGLTYLPYVARAAIETLRRFPTLNATLENGTLTRFNDVNLGIAVSLGEEGLIVPVIRRAQELSVEGLARAIKDYARRGRSGDLSPDEVQGGTFTITNPGSFGSIIATPVINQPQVAILDTEAVIKRPVVVTDRDGNDAIAIRPMTYFCLSWDHRALDGALAAQFLAAVKAAIETPSA